MHIQFFGFEHRLLPKRFFMKSRLLPDLITACCLDFSRNRSNGNPDDVPPRPYPGGGSYVWRCRFECGLFVFGMPADGLYIYELFYMPRPEELAWFEQKDRNYLTRILGQGDLQRLEPQVWGLYEADGRPPDIGEWWSQKLRREDLEELLENAEGARLYRALLSDWRDASSVNNVPAPICQICAEYALDGEQRIPESILENGHPRRVQMCMLS